MADLPSSLHAEQAHLSAAWKRRIFVNGCGIHSIAERTSNPLPGQ
jgi:hypothetical protein